MNVPKAQLQSKFQNYFQRLNQSLTKPETRFIRDISIGILKSQEITLNQIGIHLLDNIKLKSTLERFRRQLSKPDILPRLIPAHLQAVRSRLHAHDYALVDISDIRKRYARFQEGLAPVRDGSRGEIGTGYWFLNIFGVNRSGNTFTPLLSQFYSFAMGTLSENNEILSGIKQVLTSIRKALIWVIDRGGDRDRIIRPLIRMKQFFIIRLIGKRNLEYKGKSMPIRQISRSVSLLYRYQARRIHKNRLKYETYDVGVIPVKYIDPYTHQILEQPLYLVVMKGVGKGYSQSKARLLTGWFLVNSPLTDPTAIARDTFQGYGYRWHIEEYHRHIKDQFNLENIQLRKFDRLQTMLMIMAIAMYLLYTETRSIHQRLLTENKIKTIAKANVWELIGFVYYKIGTIFRILLSTVVVRAFIPLKKFLPTDVDQLSLALD
jgi:hypothetical protein